MKASEARKAAAFGATGHYWDHAAPEAELSQLWPALVAQEGVVLEPTAEVLSWDMANLLVERGDHVEDIPFHYYRDQTYAGKKRLIDNSDWLTGKEPLYGNDLQLCNEIRLDVHRLIKEMIARYDNEEAGLIGSMEMQDLPKITAQQWKPTGWYLNSPITDAEVPQLGEYARSFVKKICDYYGRRLKMLNLPTDIYQLIAMDDDPPDTMTGAPTFASGDRTHEARLAILRAIKSPTDATPQEWVADILALEQKFMMPEKTMYSPVVSTRMGPLKKPVNLWVRNEGSFSCSTKSVGAYNRTRFVFPAPYYINFLLSPLYVQMSGVRKHKLGLWHDPDHQTKYIAKLRAQGHKPWSIDFSGMDTGMFKHVVLAFVRGLRDAGFCRWSAEMFELMYPQMGITFPHYGGDPSMSSMITGDATPWCSGFKLTSEMDTIYGMTVLLSCLELQHPGITDMWMNDKWCFLELGDDIMFTTDFDIDGEKLAKDALELWGAKLEIIHDAMFLKWFIPVDPQIPKLTRSFARFIQQTFYNEDRYSGVEGGTRPDAIMRLALMARMQGLQNHPHFEVWWPKVYAIVAKLKYIQSGTPAYKERLRSGTPSLSEGDESEILAYAQRQPSYFLNLRARASYEPSAAQALRMMEDNNLSLNMDPIAQQMRELYITALKERPSAEAYATLGEYITPLIM